MMESYKTNNSGEVKMKMKNLKPFDLQAALNGEAVMLRDGCKAYVRHHETELSTATDEALIGYHDSFGMWSWCVDGAYNPTVCESQHDIIGMYPKTRIINGLEVPAPETVAPEIGGEYYIPCLYNRRLHDGCQWDDDSFDLRTLERGLVFLNAGDAIANAKAMLGIDPYEEAEE